jgi:hypothetical protein
MNRLLYSLALLPFLMGILGCDSETETDPDIVSADLPEAFKKIYGATDIYVEGAFVIVEVTGVPDHKSPYFQNTSSLYEAYNGTNSLFQINPNRITTQDYTFKIPIEPKASTNPVATPLGAIGVSLNGVPFFNQYAGPNQPLTNEINTFDQYAGHPAQQGRYHYHVEPLYLTSTKGKDALLGFLLDGFPVYGPLESGKLLTNALLDKYHGHAHATADYPAGIYHYHITSEDPYINGSGFYGVSGTVSQ